MKVDSIQKQLEEEQKRLLDAELLERLRMTPEERIDAHESALKLLIDLRLAGETLRAESK